MTMKGTFSFINVFLTKSRLLLHFFLAAHQASFLLNFFLLVPLNLRHSDNLGPHDIYLRIGVGVGVGVGNAKEKK